MKLGSAKLNAGVLALALTLGSSAFAANIYVRNAMGTDLSSSQVSRITQEVKRAVTKNGQNSLAQSESDADFVLQPSIVQRGDQMVLRVEKENNGEVLAMSEQPVSSSDLAATDVASVTDIALQDNSNDDQSSGTVSGSTSNDSATYPNQQSSGYNADGSSIGSNNANVSNNGSVSGNTTGSDMNSDMNSGANTSSGANMATTTNDTASDTASNQGQPRINREASSGDIRAPSPRILNENRSGYFQLGVGNTFGLGLKTDEVMYNINAAYNYNVNRQFTTKALIDANLGTGAEPARFIDVAVGGEYYPEQNLFTFGAPYLGADIGYAFTRNGDDRTKDAPALAADAGFKFQALQLNWDLAVRYTYLTADIDNTHPSIFGGHVAVNF